MFSYSKTLEHVLVRQVFLRLSFLFRPPGVWFLLHQPLAGAVKTWSRSEDARSPSVSLYRAQCLWSSALFESSVTRPDRTEAGWIPIIEHTITQPANGSALVFTIKHRNHIYNTWTPGGLVIKHNFLAIPQLVCSDFLSRCL